MTTPNITSYSAGRLVEYHLFTVRMSQSGDNTRGERNGRMAWMRESKRVEREMNSRTVVA